MNRLKQWWHWWTVDPVVPNLQIQKAEKIIRIAKILTTINVLIFLLQIVPRLWRHLF